LKITDVEVIKWNPGVGKNFIYIKLSTDAGITGWGEAYSQSDRDTQVETHVDQLARYLIDRDPFHIRHFMHVAHEDFATKRSAMDLHCALSGIEIAMWDIVGKTLGEPIYNLIGGPVRPHIRVYANGWASGNADEVAQTAAVMVEERGFNALKFDPFPGPWREYVNRDELKQAADKEYWDRASEGFADSARAAGVPVSQARPLRQQAGNQNKFEWLIEHQVNDRPPQQIAVAYEVDRQSVVGAIRILASKLAIELRSRSGGRPPKQN